MHELLPYLPAHAMALVFAAVLAEQAGVPIPSFAVVVAAGTLAARGGARFDALVGVAVIAALIANLAWYAAGRRYGGVVLRLLCRISLSPDTCVRLTEGIFQRWGLASLLVAKFVPGFSLVAPPIAGAVRMPVARFIVASMAGTLLWSATWLTLGVLFRDQLGVLFAWLAERTPLAVLLLAAALAVYIGWRGWQRRRVARTLAVPRIGVEALRRRLAEASPPLLIDVRSALMLADQPMLPGASAASLEALEAGTVELPGSREVVCYCACPNEASAARAAAALIARGITAYALAGGVDAWVAAGAPLQPPGLSSAAFPAA
ncbi:MAG: VTT domain-containing protein [Gammaproteobacteria bacterium]|nr:VTT domain-containing protein [Gammaproteobacteria bacterium]